MTQKIYRPSAAGGELQLKVGSNWVPIYGLSNISISGGDREVTTFETLDGGVESSVGAAGVKDIAITLNPSFFNAQYNKIIENAYYGNDQISVRYRTLAQASDIAKGKAGQGAGIKKFAAGLGVEGVLTFEASTDEGKTAADAIKETAELGLIHGNMSAVTRNESEPDGDKFFIVRYDGSAYQASSWKGTALASDIAAATGDAWVLMRYGIAFEYEVRVTSGGNPDMSPGSPIGDTLNLQQVASGFKKYPILKAAA